MQIDRNQAIVSLYDAREERSVRLESASRRAMHKTKTVRELEKPLKDEKNAIFGKMQKGQHTPADIDRLIEINAYLNYYRNLKQEKTINEREVATILRKQIKEDTKRIRRLRNISPDKADEVICQVLRSGEHDLAAVVVTVGEPTVPALEGRRG